MPYLPKGGMAHSGILTDMNLLHKEDSKSCAVLNSEAVSDWS